MRKCETCGSYIVTAEGMKEFRKPGYGHPDPVGELGVPGVDGIPEITLEPRRVGHWILESDEEEPNPMFKLVKCSACGDKANHTYKFCPNCGAKMKETI